MRPAVAHARRLHCESVGDRTLWRYAKPMGQGMDGQRFKKIRHRLGLSAAALGRALGYSGSNANIARTIYRLESGRPIPRPVGRLLEMFDAYGVPRAWAAETAQRQRKARSKRSDHSTLEADLIGVAMHRIAERGEARHNSLASITKASHVPEVGAAEPRAAYATDRAV
jgi:transcriptional regulator with XRE-family HTH domain